MVAGCAVGEDYVAPTTVVDSQWQQLDAERKDPSVNIEIDDNIPWWTKFGDPTMSAIITKAIKENNDLKVAGARIAEAQADEANVYSGFFPQIQATGNAKRGTLGGSYKNHLENSTQGGLDGSWDIDVFGGNRRRDEAAQANIEAATAEAEQTRLKMIEEIARNYVRLRGLQQQVELTQKNIQLQKQTLNVTNEQFKERVATRLDVLRAEAQVNRTRSRLPELQHQIDTVVNRLTVLVAGNVREMNKQLEVKQPLPSLPVKIVASTPIAVMQARPDIRVAERHLAQATALTSAAFAEFFPKISLGGFFGISGSSEFGHLQPWNALLSGALPILNFGKIQAGVDAADARQKQAYFNFHQTVLAAVEDVEVAFSAYQNESKRIVLYSKIAAEQDEAVLVARTQYINGLVPQLDLLDAQQNLLDAQTNMVQSQEQMLEYTIGIYTALGKSTVDSNQAQMNNRVDGDAKTNKIIESKDSEESPGSDSIMNAEEGENEAETVKANASTTDPNSPNFIP